MTIAFASWARRVAWKCARFRATRTSSRMSPGPGLPLDSRSAWQFREIDACCNSETLQAPDGCPGLFLCAFPLYHPSAHMASTDTDRKIIIRIRRQDGPSAASRWEEFAVPWRPNMNIISCLQAIAANPVMTSGQQTTPPVWDSGCLEEVCGACTMVINRKVRQACSALADKLGAPGGPIALAPRGLGPRLPGGRVGALHGGDNGEGPPSLLGAGRQARRAR